MLNFKTASILFLVACGGIILLHYTANASWWWLLPVILIYKIFIITGSANINSNFYAPVYCKGTTSEKEIVLTFDDGPTLFTKDILHSLSLYQVPATFFLIGKNIQGNESLVKQIISEGHHIGNHTFSHSFFIDFKNVKGFKQELIQTDEAVTKITGKRLKLFRPPYGVTTPHLVRAARELGYILIGWNVRSMDTTNDSEDVIVKRVTEQIKPGAIVLLHDTSDKTNAVLKRVLAFVKENNYKIVSLEKMLDIVK